jgi:hypothetical protein
LRKKAKKFRLKGKHLLIAYILIFIVVVVVTAVISHKEHSDNLPLASEYFDIKVVKARGQVLPGNKSVNIKMVVLNITAIGGEANEIILEFEGMLGEQRVAYKSHLDKGEWWCDENTTPRFENYIVPVNDKGEVVLKDFLTIGCKEARGATISLYIPLNEIEPSI